MAGLGRVGESGLSPKSPFMHLLSTPASMPAANWSDAWFLKQGVHRALQKFLGMHTLEKLCMHFNFPCIQKKVSSLGFHLCFVFDPLSFTPFPSPRHRERS